MSRVILLDSGPLGLLTDPPGKPGPATDCARWLAGRLAARDRVLVPGSPATRRGGNWFVRRKTRASAGWTPWRRRSAILPLTTVIMRHAADLWAPATADGRALGRLKRQQVVGRSFAWLKGYRRVGTRYERRCDLYDGFVTLACALIALNRLL